MERDAAGPFVDCVQMNLSALAALPCMSEAVRRSSSAERRVGSGGEGGSGESYEEGGGCHGVQARPRRHAWRGATNAVGGEDRRAVTNGFCFLSVRREGKMRVGGGVNLVLPS